MANAPSFVEHVLELLAGVGPVRARAMFGAHGLSLYGRSIGIIDDDRVFLRADEQTRDQFIAAGSEAFCYPSKNGPMTMNGYWSLPEEAYDDEQSAARWGRLAVGAADRAEAQKAAKAKRRLAKKAAPPKKNPAPPKKAAPVDNRRNPPSRTRR